MCIKTAPALSGQVFTLPFRFANILLSQAKRMGAKLEAKSPDFEKLTKRERVLAGTSVGCAPQTLLNVAGSFC